MEFFLFSADAGRTYYLNVLDSVPTSALGLEADNKQDECAKMNNHARLSKPLSTRWRGMDWLTHLARVYLRIHTHSRH
jgi:hypothetical protein